MAESRGTLAPADYVDRAMAFVDEQGLAALTMRALGEFMGVDATAVYRHFPNKDGLIDAMLDRLLGEAIEMADDQPTARERILAVATNLRATFRRHPHLTAAFASSNGAFANGLKLTTRMIDELRALGLAGEDLVRMYQSFESFLIGSSILDTGGYPQTFEIRQARYRYLNQPEFDDAARSPEKVQRITEEAFISTLNRLLDYCEHLAHHSSL